jgi:nucleoside 2-deoxyribosyltransferase
MKTNRIYFASPFFNEEQVEREERLKKALREMGFDVFSPKENCLCPPDASKQLRQQTFNDNVREIVACDIIFVVTDGKDVGTIWEAGLAYGFKLYNDVFKVPAKKIVYYCETLPEGGKFNLMLAQSGDVVITNMEQLKNLSTYLKRISKGEVIDYAGNIE